MLRLTLSRRDVGLPTIPSCSEWATIKNSARAVVFSRKKEGVLLNFSPHLGIYELPGGGVEPGESPEEAAIREVREETGYECRLVRPLGNITEVRVLSGKIVKSHGFILETTHEFPHPQKLNSGERRAEIEPEWVLLPIAGRTLALRVAHGARDEWNAFTAARDTRYLEEAKKFLACSSSFSAVTS